MYTPYQWTKQVASHWGGTRNGTIVHWPNGHRGAGRAASQFTHVIDVAPTILEAAGLPEPTIVNGVQQSPMEGTSMLYTFDDADAPERHDLQYFEMFGNRGIYHKGWSAVTKHRTPWVMVGDDGRLRRRRVGALRRQHRLDARPATSPPSIRRCSPSCSGCGSSRPPSTTCCRSTTAASSDSPRDRPAGRRSSSGNSQLFFPGMGRLSENSVVNIKNKSFTVTAEVDVAPTGRRTA